VRAVRRFWVSSWLERRMRVMKERVWEELEELSLMMNEVVRDVSEREALLNASLERNKLDRGQRFAK
jgi:hypothetical protein